jgi:hypothetical protein
MSSNAHFMTALGTATNATPSPNPSPTVPEFPSQIVETALFVAMLLVASTAAVVRKRISRKS